MLFIYKYFLKVYVKILVGYKIEIFYSYKIDINLRLLNLNFVVLVYYIKIKYLNYLKKSF